MVSIVKRRSCKRWEEFCRGGEYGGVEWRKVLKILCEDASLVVDWKCVIIEHQYSIPIRES